MLVPPVSKPTGKQRDFAVMGFLVAGGFDTALAVACAYSTTAFLEYQKPILDHFHE